MFLQIGKLLGQGYILLLTLAARGLVGANVAGFSPLILEFTFRRGRSPDLHIFRLWMQGGWLTKL